MKKIIASVLLIATVASVSPLALATTTTCAPGNQVTFKPLSSGSAYGYWIGSVNGQQAESSQFNLRPFMSGYKVSNGTPLSNGVACQYHVTNTTTQVSQPFTISTRIHH